MLTRRQVGMLVALTLVWGANWPVMKFSLREITPLWFRALTMSAGALVLMAWFVSRRVDMRLPRHEVGRVAWLALPNIIGWHFFSIIGLQELASGRAAILGFTMPVWTVLLGVLLLGQRMTARTWTAAVLATAAVGLLSASELAALAGRPSGVLWMQLAAISWAAGTLLMRRTATSLPTEAVTVWMMVIGALFFWVVAPLAEPAPALGRLGSGVWVALAYVAFVNFGYAQVIWFSMARDLPPTASAFSIMAVPAVGTAFGMLIVGERPTLADWAAALCIVLAIAAALLPRRAPAR
ncbi:MAG: DMT family transporter [Ideonella sp.]|jgi:drug/metabolite transporter (DMT)-like permease|nr:DMT family transporter [Ideonella sp.]